MSTESTTPYVRICPDRHGQWEVHQVTPGEPDLWLGTMTSDGRDRALEMANGYAEFHGIPVIEEAYVEVNTNADLPEFDVAVVVFTRVRAGDLRNAGRIASRAVGQTLVEGTQTETIPGMLVFRDPRHPDGPLEVPVRIVEVDDLISAANSGYLLRVRPTSKAYREADDG